VQNSYIKKWFFSRSLEHDKILVDREFIGVKWFKYRIEQGIEFHIRVPKQIKKGSVLLKRRKTINFLFRFLKLYDKLNYPKEVDILGLNFIYPE